MSLVVTTDDKGIVVFAKDKVTSNGTAYTAYSINIGSKDQSGNWVNGALNVRFKKDVSVLNKTKIKINKAFFTSSKYKDKVYISLMITDFEVLQPGESKPDGDGFLNIPDSIEEEAPFL